MRASTRLTRRRRSGFVCGHAAAAFAAAVAAGLAPSAARAATYVFDPGASPTGGTDGSGKWDPTTADWFNTSGGLGLFGNTVADTAVFGVGGTAGTVTVDASVTVGTIQFNAVSGSYVVNSSNAATITLGGAATINTNGVNASIGAGILKLANGTTAFNKTGVGYLFLTGDNSTNLPTLVTLNVSGGALQATGLYNSGVVVDSGRANGAAPTAYNLNGGSLVLNSSSSLGFASSRTINVLAGGGAISDGGFVQGSANGQGAFVPNVVLAAGATLNVVSSTNFAFDGGQGVVSGGGGVTTYGTGTVQFLQANTYTGSTNISGGTTLSVNTVANTGTASSLGQGTGNLIIAGTTGSQNTAGAGAALLFTGTTGATNRGLTLAGTVQNTINVSTGSLTISGPVTDLGVSGTGPRFYKEGAGTLSFTYAGANNFNGFKFLVDGGTLNFATPGQVDQFAADLIIGNQLSQAGTSPVLNLAGSTLNLTGSGGLGTGGLAIGNGDPNNNQVLTLNMSSGTLNAPTIYTNYNTAATGLQAFLNVSGGAVNCPNGLYLEETNGSTTVLNLSGTGTTFNVSGTATLSAAGTTAVSQTGGTFTSTQALSISSGGATTYNLTGGALAVPSINQTGGTGTLNLNGGTIRALGSSGTFMTGLSAANVLAGGGTIDTQSYAITIAQPLLASAASPGGGLTVVASNPGGTLTLTGNNTYTGGTTVGLGATLAISGAGTVGAPGGNLSLAGTFNTGGGSQSVGKLTTAYTAGTGNTNSAGTIDFVIGAGGSVNTMTATSASLANTYTGIQLNPAAGGSITPGVYTLVTSAAGGLTGTVGFAGGQNLTVPANQAIESIGGTNYRLTLAGTGSALTVTVVPAPAHTVNIMPLGASITAGVSAQNPYDGGGYRSQLYEDLVNDGRFTPQFQGSQTASEANNPTGTDLATAVGQTAHEGHPGYTTGNVLANLTTGAGWLAAGNGVNPDYVTLNVGGNDYVANPNDTTVITRLGQIIDQIAAARPNATDVVSSILYRGDGGGAAGNGIVTLLNPLIPGLVYQKVLAGDHVSFVDLYTVVTPGNSVANIGPDLIHPTQAGYDLTADAWYKAITTGQAFYTGSGGATFNATGPGGTTSFAQDFQRTTDAGVVPAANTDVYFNGGGPTSPFTVTLAANAAVRSLNFTAGAVTPVTIGGTSTLAIGASGITVQAGTAAHTVAANVNLAAAQTWADVSANRFTVTGNVGGTGPLTVGVATPPTGTTSGVVVLGGSNTYGGGTTVAGGTLVAANTTGSATGAGPVTVSAGSTLAGTGTIAGTVAVSGTITGGLADGSLGTLTTGSQTWYAGGTYVAKVDAANTATDRLVMSGLTVSSAPASPFTIDLAGGNATAATGTFIVAVDTGATTTDPFTLANLVLQVNQATPSSNFSLAERPDTTGQGGYDLVVVAAPEPASLLLLGLAIAPLAVGRRRSANCALRPGAARTPAAPLVAE